MMRWWRRDMPSAVGKQGKTGATGATGADGAQGLKGDPGPQAIMAPDLVLIRKRDVRSVQVLAAYIAVILTVFGILIVGSLGTNSGQDKQLRALTIQNRELIADQTVTSYKACLSGNALRKQSNLRIPLEQIELATAIEVGVINKKFNLPPIKGVKLDPGEIREKRNELRRVSLRGCQDEYQMPVERAGGKGGAGGKDGP